MNPNLLKQVPVRIEDREYQKLRKRVLYRDGWRCQSCGSMTNLEVHHQQFRSHSGPDHEDNLITLCNSCHSAEHDQDKSASDQLY
jgi:5-methylcytosine-specific restriction endonuclease McrA